MKALTSKRLLKNEYVKTAMMIILLVVVVFGFWFGSQMLLNTSYPALAVASGSMCIVQKMNCDGQSHPFDSTLHVGDLIIVQGIDPQEIKADIYPNGDVIVFYKPKPGKSYPDELIVHRAIEKEVNPANNLTYFETEGDAYSGGSGDPFDTDYRGENYTWHRKISEKLVVGKVVLRVPWFGHVALFLRNSSGAYLVLILIVILVIIEFVIPIFTGKESDREENDEALLKPEPSEDQLQP